jgi:hypothetical protein
MRQGLQSQLSQELQSKSNELQRLELEEQQMIDKIQ